MKSIFIHEIKRKNKETKNIEFLYIPIDWYEQDKSDPPILEYFIRGEGHKKTKSFKRIKIEIPETKDNVRDISYFYNLYGKQICLEYLITNNCESWKDHMLNKAIFLSKKLGEDLFSKCPDKLLNIIDFDWRLACFGIWCFDIVETDKKLKQIIPEYDFEKCEYNEKQTSMREMIQRVFGEIGVEVIEKLNKT